MKVWWVVRCGWDRTPSHSGRMRDQAPTWSSDSMTSIAPGPAVEKSEERGTGARRPRVTERTHLLRDHPQARPIEPAAPLGEIGGQLEHRHRVGQVAPRVSGGATVVAGLAAAASR